MTPKKTPKPKMPPLVPQPGGRGAIYQGGVPGNKGGLSHPSEVRALVREGFVEALPKLRELALEGNVKAIAVLAKHAGLSITKNITEDEVRSRLVVMLAEIDVFLRERYDDGAEAFEELQARIGRAWKK